MRRSGGCLRGVASNGFKLDRNAGYEKDQQVTCYQSRRGAWIAGRAGHPKPHGQVLQAGSEEPWSVAKPPMTHSYRPWHPAGAGQTSPPEPSAADPSPLALLEDATQMAALHRLALDEARRCVRNPLLAEEAAESACFALTVEVLGGRPPRCAAAWLRIVARRTAAGILRKGQSRCLTLDGVLLDRLPASRAAQLRAGGLRREAWRRRFKLLHQPLMNRLTPRQNEVLDSVLHSATTRAAARRCGMSARDLRRSMQSISKHAREVMIG